MLRKNLSPPDRRRGDGPPSKTTTTSPPPSSSLATSRSRGRATSNSSTSAGSNGPQSSGIIAPPPRAALGAGAGGAGSSAAPDEHGMREGNGGGDNGGTGGGRQQHHTDKEGPDAKTAKTATIAGAAGPSPAFVSASASVSTSTSAAAHMSRGKDAQIAELRRELEVMEAEFLRELDRLSANESETATFWQQRHGRLNQEFLRADAELRLLRIDTEARDADRAALRAALDTASRNLRDRDTEIRSLRSQVRGLKEWVSTSTRSDGQSQTSDEVFGEGMAKLGNGLQNWVIVNFRRAKLCLSQAGDSALAELARLVPAYEDVALLSKVHLLQSVVSRILVEMVFGAYFAGLPAEREAQLVEMEAFLSSYASSAETVNQWRSSTLTILKRDAAGKLEAETAATAEAVVAKVNAVLGAITDAAGGSGGNGGSTESRDQGLRPLVTGSIELSRLLAVQKAVFKISMPEILPHQRVIFDPTVMEDMGGEDEESLAQREICCVTFPGIVKTGDENGGHLQFRNVISKAHVLCRPE